MNDRKYVEVSGESYERVDEKREISRKRNGKK